MTSGSLPDFADSLPPFEREQMAQELAAELSSTALLPIERQEDQEAADEPESIRLKQHTISTAELIQKVLELDKKATTTPLSTNESMRRDRYFEDLVQALTVEETNRAPKNKELDIEELRKKARDLALELIEMDDERNKTTSTFDQALDESDSGRIRAIAQTALARKESSRQRFIADAAKTLAKKWHRYDTEVIEAWLDEAIQEVLNN